MANELTSQPQSNSPEKTISSAVSPRLTSLLAASDREKASEAIAADPELLAEARAVIPSLRAQALATAGELGVRDIVGRAFATYPQPSRGDGEWAAFWEPYVALCATIPTEALRAAMLAHMAGDKRDFLPRAGDLAALALTVPTPSASAHAIASKAAHLAGLSKPEFSLRTPDIPTLRRVPTAAERAAVRSMAASYSAGVDEQLAREREGKPKMQPTAGKTAPGSGLTPEMLALLGRPIPRAQPDPPPADTPEEFYR